MGNIDDDDVTLIFIYLSYLFFVLASLLEFTLDIKAFSYYFLMFWITSFYASFWFFERFQPKKKAIEKLSEFEKKYYTFLKYKKVNERAFFYSNFKKNDNELIAFLYIKKKGVPSHFPDLLVKPEDHDYAQSYFWADESYTPKGQYKTIKEFFEKEKQNPFNTKLNVNFHDFFEPKTKTKKITKLHLFTMFTIVFSTYCTFTLELNLGGMVAVILSVLLLTILLLDKVLNETSIQQLDKKIKNPDEDFLLTLLPDQIKDSYFLLNSSSLKIKTHVGYGTVHIFGNLAIKNGETETLFKPSVIQYNFNHFKTHVYYGIENFNGECNYKKTRDVQNFLEDNSIDFLNLNGKDKILLKLNFEIPNNLKT